MEEENNTNEIKKMDSTSADDLKDRVKETVQKGVAAVAGALKGFSEEAKKHNLAESTKDAIQKAGEATRQVVGATTEEFQRTKRHVKEKVASAGSGGSSSSLGSSSLGSSSVESSSYGSPLTGLGEPSSARGTSLRENGMQGGAKDVSSTLPDLRKTDLAKDDEDLAE